MNLKPLRRILKYISLSLLGLILFLLLFLFVGLNLPFVQKQIGKSVAKFLEKKIETPVNIDKVAIHLFDRVALHGVYFEDQKADTLLATSDLIIDIDLKKLLKKTVEVDKIIINDLTATMRQEDSIFNFQYIIDAFAPKNPKPKKEKSSSPWTISLQKLELNNTHALLDLKSGQQDIALKSLHVNLKSLDLEKMDIALNSIAIESVNYVANFKLGKSKREYDPTIFPLSTVPIKVTVQKLSISNSYVDIITGENNALGTTFNPQHIQAKDLNIDFKNVYFDSTRASLTAKNISTEFGQQIDIQHLSGNLIFSDKETGATNLELKTGKSEANLDASLSYDIFKTFILFEDDLQVDIKGKPINLHADELSYFIPTLTEAIDINQLPSKNIRINTSISGDLANLDIKNLDASIGETKASISGIVKHPTQTNRIQFNDVAVTANASTKDIEKIIGRSKLPIDIKPFGRIDLASKLTGNLKELQLEKFTVKTGLTTNVDFAGTIQNLDQIDQLQYNLNINKIETASNDVIKILDSIPAIAKNIEFLTYSGQIAGSLTSFDLDGEIRTNLGKIFPDLKIDFNEKYSNAVYKGDLKIDDFQLGQLLDNDSIGNVTLTAKVDGRGLSLDTIDTQLDVNINSIVYNSYVYHDLNIEGCFYKKEFEGDINFNDENLAFDFNGKIGLNNEIPNLNFTMKLDTLNLGALHLSKIPLSASMVITSDLSEATLNNMNGEVKIRDIRLSKEGRTWQTDSIAIIASNKNNGDNEVLLASEIINGSIIGDFSFVNIVPAIMHSLDEYFPFSELINAKKGLDSIPEQSFKGAFYVSNPRKLTNFFTESTFKLDTAMLILDFDSRKDLVDIDLQVPEFAFGNNTLKNIAVVSKTSNNQLSFTIASDSIIIGNSVQIPSLEVGTTFKENMGTYGIKIKDEEAIDQFALTGKITSSEKLYEFIIDKSVVLDAKNWRLNMNEPFVIGEGEFEYPAFDLIRGDQGIFLSKGENKEIDLYFEAFEASNITNFILNDSTSLEGSINGSLKIATLEDPMTIEGDLYIGAIQYNGIEIGNLGMEFQNIGGSYTTASIDLSDLFTNVHIDAILSEGGKIDGEVDIKQFQLKAIEPFLRKYVKNVKGDLAGKLIIGGSLKAPDVDGTLSLNDAGTEVISLGSYYTVKKGDFDISKDNIDVKTVFVDSKQRVANLTGNITHNYFSNIGFNLNFSAESFTFLDSKKQKNLPFYGLLNAELDADITGTINKPEIFAVFATDDSTDITIEAITNNSSVSNEPYIIFVDNGDYTLNEIDSIISLRYKISTIFDLTVYANINDEAKLKVVIDPISGDYLDVIGNGNMVVDVNESGQLLINGNYEVSSGQYRFTFEDFFLKRFFEIVPGGQITFVGDIMSSKLDLAAAYKLKTSTYSLIENEFTTLSEDEKIAAKKPNTEVNVVLSITGELNQPQIDFDIKIPQNTGNTVSSSVARALEKLRSNKTELNTQVFSLLLLQGFTTINSTSSDIAYNASSQIAFSSVSSFLNNQLKKLTNKAKGLEVGVGIASTANDVLSGDAGSEADNSFAQSTNIDVFIKQSLLNDRLILELGTNLDLNSGNSEGGLTNVAGDFVLEYKLTKEGNLRLNVFQKSDYSLLNDNNVWKTGIGLSYQKTFGKLIKRGSYKQTEEINKDAPIENKETIPIEIPSDSIENKEAPKPISK